MKKTLSLFAVLALCLGLCACSAGPVTDTKASPVPAHTAAPTQAPAPAETPDTTGEPAPVKTPDAAEKPVPAETAPPVFVPAEEGYPIAVPMGSAFSADLNGDGVTEEICVSIVPDGDNIDAFKITLNGEDVSDVLYRDYWVDFPEASFWFVTDVYSVDDLLEIAVQDWGPSDDPHTMFLRYESGEVYAFGDVPGMIRTESGEGDIRFERDGFVHTDRFRLGVLQTWFADADYEIGNAGWLTYVPQELWIPHTSTQVKSILPLTVYDLRGGAESRTLAAGTDLTILATDDTEWIHADTGAGTVWLHLNPDHLLQVETPEGFVDGNKALEGLCYAD